MSSDRLTDRNYDVIAGMVADGQFGQLEIADTTAVIADLQALQYRLDEHGRHPPVTRAGRPGYLRRQLLADVEELRARVLTHVMHLDPDSCPSLDLIRQRLADCRRALDEHGGPADLP